MSFLGIRSKEYADAKGRDYYFDNAKFILIVLVVLAHGISPLKGGDKELTGLWLIINAFHMPCLIMISGYFAKGYIRKDGTVKYQRWFTYIVYYLAAQITVSLFEYFVLGYHNMSKSFLNPRSSLWYLMCLIWWFALLPLLDKFKPSYVMIGAILFGLCMGYDTSMTNYLSVGRVFSHLPFFLMGYYFKKEWVFKYRNKITQIGAAVIFIIICYCFYRYPSVIPSRIITSNFAYKEIPFVIFTQKYLWFVNRFIYWIVAAIMCFCFMLLVPRGKAAYTKFGSRTLQVYILHRFLYLADLEYEWYAPLKEIPYGGVIMGLIAIAIAIILCFKPFEIPFKWLGSIKIDWFAKKETNEN